MEINAEMKALVDDFLADLAYRNRSAHTIKAYTADLGQLFAFHGGSPDELDARVLRDFTGQDARLAPATRARKQSTLSSFLVWAYRHDRVSSNPMLKLERVQRKRPAPRGLSRESVEQILATIAPAQRRDHLLFRLAFETGLRISEALHVHIEDLDLTRDDERLTVVGKGGRQRTILLDDPRLLKELRTYLKVMDYKRGFLFRAAKNGDGGAVRYQSIQERWVHYCELAGVVCTIHQLRHSHATEMVNGGVSLGTIRKRLGHKSIQTTLLYAEVSDTLADAELRDWRRRQGRPPIQNRPAGKAKRTPAVP